MGRNKQLDEGADRQTWRCHDPLNCVASVALRKHGTWVQIWHMGKEGDCEDVSTSDQFSWKQLRNATIEVLRRQKPSTNALDGLYLPFVDRLLEARRIEGCDESVPGRSCV